MLFNSFSFIVFLPIVFILYWKFFYKQVNNRIKLILLVTPKSNFYTSQIDRSRIYKTDSIITEIVRENDVSFINLRTAQDFDLKDFSDGDHLNSKGATKLSLKLDSLINRL